jgi:hypothetical protein
MARTKITRPHYRRDGMRYESDTTDAEWFVIVPLLPLASALGASACNRHADGDRCDSLHRVHSLPMAADTQGLPSLLDGSRLFRRVVARRTLCLAELHSGNGIARGGWPRGTRRLE